MKNFQCFKCGTSLQSDKTPNTIHCPSGSSHHWTDLGEVGVSNYQCKKCGLLLKSKSTPSTIHCTAGGSHQWSKL
jgi:DNA-directed RNA polymerase subunit RPC12/RpoP